MTSRKFSAFVAAGLAPCCTVKYIMPALGRYTADYTKWGVRLQVSPVICSVSQSGCFQEDK